MLKFNKFFLNDTVSQHKYIKSYRTNRIQYSLQSFKRSIAAGYQPQLVEKGKVQKWIEINSRRTVKNSERKFVMIIPPPNVTGYLHLGHSLMATIQDVIIRRKQQLGLKTVWVPGTDHAGIATQVVVEKMLLKEKKLTRHQLGRENFIKEVMAWKIEKEQKIQKDLQKLGCLLDWDKSFFTMDEKQSQAVKTAFIKLFDDNLIDRRNTLVNWSCFLESAVSDIEVETKEIKGPTKITVPNHNKSVTFGRIYDISYKIIDSDQEIIVSTTRPETLLGDVAVAVNPNDHRYDQFKEFPTYLWHPFRNEKIPLIFDNSVDIEFGTGAVKITPAHDKNDFEVAIRHNLNTEVQVFTEKGIIAANYQEFNGLPRFEARDNILEILSTMGLFKNMRDHKMILPLCSRSNDVIEYMLRPQWFVKCRDMAKEAVKALENNEIEIHPKSFEADWLRWLNNCRDWCISRQLWWGHQIPVYLAKTNNEELWIAASSEQEALRKAKSKLCSSEKDIVLVKDEDVLDTWFSSSLLPFSAFDWPQESFRNFYPLDIMQTGHDILFFWVARMVMIGKKLTGNVPFKKILLNGIICDAHGRKMSKSLGNSIMPDQVIYGCSFDEMKLQVLKSFDNGILTLDEVNKSISNLQKLFPHGIPECGTDALRFTLLSHNIKNHFINFDISECHTNKLFLNKIWQATRYTLQYFDKLNVDKNTIENLDIENINLGHMDKWILNRLNNTIKLCNQSYDNFNFHLATQALKTFFYSNFCDTYLEITKPAIKNDPEKGIVHCKVLSTCIAEGLKVMSIITPFIAEELLQYFPELSKPIDYSVLKFNDKDLEDNVADILAVCSTIRQLKSQNNILKKHEPTLILFPNSIDSFNLLQLYKNEILILTQNKEIQMNDNIGDSKNVDFFSTAGILCNFGIVTNETYLKVKSKSNLNAKKLVKLENDLSKLLKTISSEGYKKAASQNIQNKHLEKIKQLEKEIITIKGINQ